MEKERFIQLRDKYLSGTVDESERMLVEEYYRRLAEQEFVPFERRRGRAGRLKNMVKYIS
jgi:hypothetical protein